MDREYIGGAPAADRGAMRDCAFPALLDSATSGPRRLMIFASGAAVRAAGSEGWDMIICMIFRVRAMTL